MDNIMEDIKPQGMVICEATK